MSGRYAGRPAMVTFLFVLFEFRSFRCVRTIAGPGGVIGPLPSAKIGGQTKDENVARQAEYKVVTFLRGL